MPSSQALLLGDKSTIDPPLSTCMLDQCLTLDALDKLQRLCKACGNPVDRSCAFPHFQRMTTVPTSHPDAAFSSRIFSFMTFADITHFKSQNTAQSSAQAALAAGYAVSHCFVEVRQPSHVSHEMDYREGNLPMNVPTPPSPLEPPNHTV